MQGATSWVSDGAIVFGALAAGLSTAVLRGVGLPSWWTWTAWGAAILLIVGFVLTELTDTPAGDIAIALATAILLPIWAILLTRVEASATATSDG